MKYHYITCDTPAYQHARTNGHADGLPLIDRQLRGCIQCGRESDLPNNLLARAGGGDKKGNGMVANADRFARSTLPLGPDSVHGRRC